MPRRRALTARELTLALLHRQSLLARRSMSAPAAVRRLVAVQAQYSPSPYLGLHARLDGFAIEELERALRRGTVVKATLMRGTLHLVHRDDHAAFAAASLDQLGRMIRGRVKLPEAEHERVVGELRAFCAQPRTTDEIRARARELAGVAVDGAALDYARVHLPLVHVPPSGAWRSFGKFSLVLRDAPLPPPGDGAAALVRAYLAAYGPATRDDIAMFTGLRLGVVDAALGDVRQLTDAEGRDLLDVPRAPIPAEDTAVPVRFLPRFDVALVSHRDRSRITTPTYEAFRRGVPNGEVPAAWIADGQVAGLWRHRREGGTATMELSPLPGGGTDGVEEEALRTLRFLEPMAEEFALDVVHFGPP